MAAVWTDSIPVIRDPQHYFGTQEAGAVDSFYVHGGAERSMPLKRPAPGSLQSKRFSGMAAICLYCRLAGKNSVLFIVDHVLK